MSSRSLKKQWIVKQWFLEKYQGASNPGEWVLGKRTRFGQDLVNPTLFYALQLG
jgi:hypothetical protein